MPNSVAQISFYSMFYLILRSSLKTGRPKNDITPRSFSYGVVCLSSTIGQLPLLESLHQGFWHILPYAMDWWASEMKWCYLMLKGGIIEDIGHSMARNNFWDSDIGRLMCTRDSGRWSKYFGDYNNVDFYGLNKLLFIHSWLYYVHEHVYL